MTKPCLTCYNVSKLKDGIAFANHTFKRMTTFFIWFGLINKSALSRNGPRQRMDVTKANPPSRRVFLFGSEEYLREGPMKQKVTLLDLQNKKRQGIPIVMVTAYDYPSAKLADEAGVDMILVGDSLGMVVLGYDTTVSVTLEDMLHHTKAVTRGARNGPSSSPTCRF